MLRKNVKSLLEQFQVCIFAEIVFGVRCTLSAPSYLSIYRDMKVVGAAYKVLPFHRPLTADGTQTDLVFARQQLGPEGRVSGL